MIKTRKQMFLVIGVSTLIMLLGLTTYAFFNYTSTGSANTVSVGRMNFTSSEAGTINLTNVFPITRTAAASDNTNSGEVVITIAGDTNYSNGLEYLVSVEDVEIKTSTNKKIPVGIIVTPEEDNTELGTANANYFNDNVRGGSTSYYKVLANDILKNGDYILVGYIRPGADEVNGKIGIRAFIDYDSIAISDTYDGTESDNMGTTSDWVDGRTVLTTAEWNSLQGNNAISFKVKVQANEGIWVGEPLSRNDMQHLGYLFSSDGGPFEEQKSSITEINFIRMTEEMMNTQPSAVDLTAPSGNGVVKAWIDGTKLYVASPGETYFPVSSSGMFNAYSNLVSIRFDNVNTSLVEQMAALFSSSPRLASVDISSFDTSSVTDMASMFSGCSGLVSIEFGNIDTSSVQNMTGMFNGCTSLTSIDLSNLDTSSITNMSSMFTNCSSLTEVNVSGLGSSNLTINAVGGMFNGCTSLVYINMSGFNFGGSYLGGFIASGAPNLVTLDLSDVNISNITNVAGMFYNRDKLTTIYVTNTWYTNSITESNMMFYGCTSLVGGAGTGYDEDFTDISRAKIDGGQNNPGYFTLKTN